MYEYEEFYAVDGLELKEVLMSCILGYYSKNKMIINKKNELLKNQNHRIIETTNKVEILSMKGDNNVQTVQR